MDRDPVTAAIIGCAIEVHRDRGPGLLESAYERCLANDDKATGLLINFNERRLVEGIRRFRL